MAQGLPPLSPPSPEWAARPPLTLLSSPLSCRSVCSRAAMCACVSSSRSYKRPQVYFRAAKAPCLMARAAAVTAVNRDFMGSFTSLASSFSDDFIMPSPQPLPRVGNRQGLS